MTALVAHVEHFRWRLLQDTLAQAQTAYWLHRADTFAGVGTPTCDLIATNCRRHAALLQDLGLDDEVRQLIARALGEAP